MEEDRPYSLNQQKEEKKKIMRLSDQIISFGKSDRTSVFE